MGWRRRYPDVLDGHVDQTLEPLLDELPHVLGHEVARNCQPALQRQPAEPDRGTAQPVGIARASRPVPEREGHGKGVELVRRREHLPGLGLRQGPARRIRQVLLVDRGADGLRVAGEARVLGADVTLEIGKLAHELGCLVGLREPGRLVRCLSPA